jgi:tetratricopeptide (TPR) repeat protein
LLPDVRFVWLCIAAFAALLPALAIAQPAAGPEAKAWYLERGRANMQIENYRAAIEAFERVVELDPGDREGLRSLGFAYERQGLTDKAIEQFDRYLARFSDDPDIAFKQADYLTWSRYAYRRKDAIRYFRMGLAKREDLARRHALARLLAQDRAQVDEAIEQYEILLAAKPDDATWRNEYRELLLWEPRHLADAVREYRRLAAERPGDYAIELQLTRLIERQQPGSSEAISRYADLVARKPNDTALRLESAQALALGRGRRDEAIEQYRLVVAQKPTRQTRVELADLLSGRADSRDEAISLYQALLREQPDDVRVRMKLARLYSGERDQATLAIREYERVVAAQPENGEAHAGLAQAYAWVGDRDRALHHGNLAARYGAADRKLSNLREDLLRGREPRLGPLLRYFAQRGSSKAELDGFVLGASGQADVTPFITLHLESGFEDYWRKSHNTASGFVRLDTEVRFDPVRQIGASVGYHSLRDAAVVGKLEYAHLGDVWKLRGGFERKLRFDSYEALVGDEVDGESIGAARENRFYGAVDTERGRLAARIDPYIGWVSADGADDNLLVGTRGRIGYRLLEADTYDLTPFYAAEVLHYGEDAYGLDPTVSDPAPGGYYSPQIFVEQMPGLALSWRIGERQFLEIEAGPSFQYQEDSESSGFEFGGKAWLSYVLFLGDSLYWSLEPGFTRVGDVYTRGEVMTSLTFKF